MAEARERKKKKSRKEKRRWFLIKAQSCHSRSPGLKEIEAFGLYTRWTARLYVDGPSTEWVCN
jgi:hypothetical protein